MAVRIYALAKELKLDSKELVDICTKAGVPGKGSALASLTEEEVDKVKQFLKGGGTAKAKAGESRAAGAATAERAGARRQDAGHRHGEAARADCPIETGRTDELSRIEPAETPLAATSTAVETAVAVEASRRPGPLAGAMGREKYIGPGTATGKVPVVGAEGRVIASARRPMARRRPSAHARR